MRGGAPGSGDRRGHTGRPDEWGGGRAGRWGSAGRRRRGLSQAAVAWLVDLRKIEASGWIIVEEYLAVHRDRGDFAAVSGHLCLSTRTVATMPRMSSPELSRRVDAHGEDLRAISDTVIEIHDDVAQIRTEHGRLLVEHSVTLAGHGSKLDELSGKLDAVLALLAPGKDD